MISQLGLELAKTKSLLYLLMSCIFWGQSPLLLGNPGKLEIKVSSHTVGINETFTAEVWAYPGESDIQSLSLYVAYDTSVFTLLEWEEDPHSLADLTLVGTHDPRSGVIAYEGGFITPKTDSLPMLTLQLQTKKLSDSAVVSFLFSDEGPGTEVLNSSSRSIIQREDFSPLVLRILCPERPAEAGPDQELCENVAQLKAKLNNQEEGYWSILSGEGGSFTDPTNPFSFFVGRKEGLYTLVWNVPTNTCAKSTDTLNISFMPTPAPSEAGTDQVVFGDLTYLDATPTSFFTEGNWRILSDDAGAHIRDTLHPKSAFIGEVGYSYLLEWSEQGALCPIPPDTVSIQFRRAPKAYAGEDQVIRKNHTAQLTANVPESDIIGVWKVISGGYGKFSDRHDPESSFRGRWGLSYQLQWTLRHERTILDQDTVEISFSRELADNSPEGNRGGSDRPIRPTIERDTLINPVSIRDLLDSLRTNFSRKIGSLGPFYTDFFKDSSYFEPVLLQGGLESFYQTSQTSYFDSHNTGNKIDIFPNPVLNRKLSAYISGKLSDDIHFKILNINGQEMLRGVWEETGSHFITLEGFSPGIYTLFASSSSGANFFEKIYVK